MWRKTKVNKLAKSLNKSRPKSMTITNKWANTQKFSKISKLGKVTVGMKTKILKEGDQALTKIESSLQQHLPQTQQDPNSDQTHKNFTKKLTQEISLNNYNQAVQTITEYIDFRVPSSQIYEVSKNPYKAK